jgi:hypothetical protein
MWRKGLMSTLMTLTFDDIDAVLLPLMTSPMIKEGTPSISY